MTKLLSDKLYLETLYSCFNISDNWNFFHWTFHNVNCIYKLIYFLKYDTLKHCQIAVIEI